MSHEVETMFSARQVPWHGLGTVTEDVLTGDEAIVAAGLDWRVEQAPVFAELPDGNVPVDDKVVNYRDTDGAILGVVGTDYVPVQNELLFDFADDVLDDGSAKYESAGSLRDGRVVFITAKLDREVTIDGDRHEPYLVIASSHDGSMGVKLMATPVRVVCMNTLRLAIGRAKSAFSIRHTANAEFRVNEARKALGMSWEYYDAFEAEVEALMNQDVTTRQFDSLVGKAFPKAGSDRQENTAEERRSMIRTIYEADPAVSPYNGTGWGVLNALNTWELWQRPVRATNGGADDETTLRNKRNAMRILWGNEAPLTGQTHKRLVAARVKS